MRKLIQDFGELNVLVGTIPSKKGNNQCLRNPTPLCGLAWTEEKHPELMDIPAVKEAWNNNKEK